MLIPETILPVQYQQRARCWTPLHRLALAVVEEALRNLEYRVVVSRAGDYGDRRRCAVAANATAWFASDDETWPLSFRNCCTLLEFDPEAVRARLSQVAPTSAIRNPGAPPKVTLRSTRRHRTAA